MKSRLFVYFLGGLFILAIIGGCAKNSTSPQKDDPYARHKDAFADVFVKRVKSPQGDKYGLIFYAGGQGLTKTTANTPDGKQYELAEFWKGAGNMRRHPANNEMTSQMPDTGVYSFAMEFSDGDQITLKDTLFSDEIPAIGAITVNHAAGSDSVKVQWSSVPGVDVYYVKLTDKGKNEDKPIFVNNKISATVTNYSFDHSTVASPGWMQPTRPAAGDTCYVFVVGLKFEAGVTGAASNQNKQMNTVAGKLIVW